MLAPDVKWISHLVAQRISHPDVKPVSHRKDSSSKEALKRSPRPQPPPPSSGQKPGTGTGTKPEPVFFDDDDDPKAEPKPTLSPEAEFSERLAARHGASFDFITCTANVKHQLAKVGGLTFADFLEFDSVRSTGTGGRSRIRTVSTSPWRRNSYSAPSPTRAGRCAGPRLWPNRRASQRHARCVSGNRAG